MFKAAGHGVTQGRGCACAVRRSGMPTPWSGQLDGCELFAGFDKLSFQAFDPGFVLGLCRGAFRLPLFQLSCLACSPTMLASGFR